MELIDWANGGGQTLTLTQDEASELLKALKEAISIGHGNIVFDYSELDIEIKDSV